MEFISDPFFRVVLVGFSNSIWKSDAIKKEDVKLTTRPNRAPETILRLSFDHRIDTWAVGCLFFRILTLDDLFKPKGSSSKTYSVDEDHLA